VVALVVILRRARHHRIWCQETALLKSSNKSFRTMETYIGQVQDALKDLAGEGGLALKIASDVRDCMTLDVLQNIHEVSTSEVLVVEHMRRQTNHDTRVAVAGLDKIVSILSSVERRFSIEFVTSREFVQAGGPDMVLSCMTQSPELVGVQKNGSLILSKVLNYAVSPATIQTFFEDPQMVNALVNAAALHLDNMDLLEAAITTLSVMELTQNKHMRHLHNEAGDRIYPLQTFVVAAGGIAHLFAAVGRYPHNYSIGACALNVLQSLRMSESTLPNLVRYAREHPEWRTIVGQCNATGGLEAYLLRHTLRGT